MATRARGTLVHEIGMLLVICLLEVWRVTGVPLHEWLAVVLAAAVFAHLLLQRSWVMAHVRRWKVSVALNALLFIAFSAATISGIAISKVLMPRHLAPAEFLKWHSIHDTSSKLVLLLVALHLALNWDVVKRLGRRRELARGRKLALGYAAALLVAALAVGGAVYGIERLLPAEESVMVYSKDGKVTRMPPPREVAELRRDQSRPNLAQGLPKFAVTLGAVGVVALAGRKVLRLRL